ncbi:hypothetical protein Nocox_17740 [Nonomuraea coxensis DSM 45129]|uniref:DUF2157 domain-containing protein n=1 Tax=Nonomuraea coxensis DSM 45129 TaxID=1122611 RepID=A0ABX8U3E3_9ACTN|nr:DUF2157 domain-containing protein [Nonomuraea coxensis]QYC41157.1 hypothetical protein Nocox_17740 [Nonomuraea coxensis DSM 45129]
MTQSRDEVLRRLVREGVLTAAQALAVHEALDEAERPARARWAEVAGYVGGALLLAGAVSLAGTSWPVLSTAARVLILVSATAALLAAGLLLADLAPRLRASRLRPSPGGGPGGSAPRVRAGPGEWWRAWTAGAERAGAVRRRSGGVALALASVTGALAASELSAALTGSQLVAAAVTGLVLAVAGYVALPGGPCAVAVAGFAALTAEAVAGELSGWNPVAVGLTLVGTGVAWTALVRAGVIGQRRLGLGLGAAVALIGAQHGLGTGGDLAWSYVATFAVAVACLVLYRWERAWVLLVAGIAGFTLAVPEAVWDWTDGAVGGSLALMIAGLVLVASSVLGLRLHRASRQDHSA